MKLLSFSTDDGPSWGAVSGDTVIDLGKLLPDCPTLADFLGSDDFTRRDAIVADAPAGIPLDSITFLPVIPQPEKIICVARNYLDHHEEAVAHGLERELTDAPPMFIRVWRSQVGHGQPVIRPRVSTRIDWEGEVAVVIGKGGRHIAEADALDHVAGYSIYNDVSVRDWQQPAQRIAAGKNFVGTGPFGPWLATPDEIADPARIKLRTLLNGEEVQASDTSLLIFDIPALIRFSSTIFDLVPGDVIVTGTPAGVGFTRKPPVFLKPGDLIEVEVEGIGTLSNPVIDE